MSDDYAALLHGTPAPVETMDRWCPFLLFSLESKHPIVLSSECPSPFLPPEHFLYQVRTECRFQNGTQRVQMLDRYFWGRQEYVRFDSQVGKFVALTELGRPDAEYWNREFLQSEKADVDRFCRHNYGIDWPFARDRRVQPIVTITPMDHPTTSQNILLICNVGRFFPPDIEIKWFKNGEEEEGSHVSSTDLIRNGDWTFQTEVMLETQLERGDVYTCQVDHASLKEPVTVQWGRNPQSDAARSKMWTGIVGCILFLVFVTPGVFLYVKNKKGDDGATWLGCTSAHYLLFATLPPFVPVFWPGEAIWDHGLRGCPRSQHPRCSGYGTGSH
uniref:Ig-like domain-containing protein n=1 Tax=Salvator merianae TaxID=96440 RepID=A0A8D0BNP1_SALMN